VVSPAQGLADQAWVELGKSRGPSSRSIIPGRPKDRRGSSGPFPEGWHTQITALRGGEIWGLLSLAPVLGQGDQQNFQMPDSGATWGRMWPWSD
jgi:hypothetical protein